MSIPSMFGGTVQETVLAQHAFPAIDILASAAQTASGAGADVTDPTLAASRFLILVCDVTAKAGTAPTLDVAVQSKIGGNYFPLAEFSQFANVTGTKMIAIKGDFSFATEIALAADPAVASGFAKKDVPWGDTLRIKYTIGGSAGQSFTFKVSAYPYC